MDPERDAGCLPESLWLATAPGRDYPALEGNVEADVCVVGAGVVGITAAYLLRQAGRSVALLDRGRVAGGVSGKTTAKVTSQHGLILETLVKRFGEARIQRHVLANEAAKDLMVRLGRAVDADVVEAPNYVYTTEPERAPELVRDADLGARLGLPASVVTDTELPFKVAAAVRYERQAHFHPRKYLLGLLDRIAGPEALVFENSPVVAVEESSGEADGRCRVATATGSVAARQVLVTTHVPILDRVAYAPRIEPRREYGIALEAGDADLEGMYVSAESPRRSVRPYRGEAGPMLVFVGETHPVGAQANRPHYAALADFARQFTAAPVRHCWSSQDAYPVDGLPLVGRHSPRARNVFAATGFRAWGMTQGTVAAQVLVDRIAGTPNPLADLYDPFAAARIFKDLVTPDLASAAGTAIKGLVVDRIVPHPTAPLGPGEGRIERHGLHEVAVSMDANGTVHKRHAACSHMGCIVAWNGLEQSWDCPCHGSRFAPDGTVLHGPATMPLKAYAAPQDGQAEAARRGGGAATTA